METKEQFAEFLRHHLSITEPFTEEDEFYLDSIDSVIVESNTLSVMLKNGKSFLIQVKDVSK